MMGKYTLTVFLLIWGLGMAAAAENDPLSLEAAIEEALAHQSSIQAAMELEKAAQAGQNAAAADLFPKLSASYAYSRLQDIPYAVFGGNHVQTGKQDRYAWQVAATQPLFTGFALSTRKQIAILDVDLRKLQTEQAMLDVAHQTRLAWYGLALAEKALGVAWEEVDQLNAHVQDAQRFYDQGAISYNDLLKARVGLAHARQGLVQAGAERRTAAAYLNTVLRRPILQEIQVTRVGEESLSAAEMGAFLDRAFVQRPELRAMQVSFEKAGLAVQGAKAGYYPELYMIGAYDRMGDNVGADHNDFGNDSNVSLSLQARWTIFEWGKTRSEVRKALYERTAIERQWQGVRDSVAMEVVEAYEKMIAAIENVQTSRTARLEAVENFRITNLRFQQGAATSTDVLDARAYLSRAELDDDRALMGMFVADADLKRAVGEK
jgi:outer membrane protein TolC